MQQRVDFSLANVVREGLKIDTLAGSLRAWVYMASHNVPQAVIERVLGEPSKVRANDYANTLEVTVHG